MPVASPRPRMAFSSGRKRRLARGSTVSPSALPTLRMQFAPDFCMHSNGRAYDLEAFKELYAERKARTVEADSGGGASRRECLCRRSPARFAVSPVNRPIRCQPCQSLLLRRS